MRVLLAPCVCVIALKLGDLVSSTRVLRGYDSYQLQSQANFARQSSCSLESEQLSNGLVRFIETVDFVFSKFRARRNVELRMQLAFVRSHDSGVKCIKSDWVIFKKLAESLNANLANTVHHYGHVIAATNNADNINAKLNAACKASIDMSQLFRRMAGVKVPDLMCVPMAIDSWESAVIAFLTALAKLVISFTFTLRPGNLSLNPRDVQSFINTWSATRFFYSTLRTARDAVSRCRLEKLVDAEMSRELLLKKHFSAKTFMNLRLRRIVIQPIQTLAIAQFWRIKPALTSGNFQLELKLIEEAEDAAMIIYPGDTERREEALIASYSPLVAKLESFQ